MIYFLKINIFFSETPEDKAEAIRGIQICDEKVLPLDIFNLVNSRFYPN